MSGDSVRGTAWQNKFGRFYTTQYRFQTRGRAQLEFIPEDSAKFVAAAKQANLEVRKSTAFYFHDEDRPGAVADILKKMADAGISLDAMQAVCGGAGRYGAVIFLSAEAAEKAATVLLGTGMGRR